MDKKYKNLSFATDKSECIMKPSIHIAPDQVEHIVTYKDGSKREARLFYSGDVLCEMNKYAQKYGHRFDTKEVVSIEPKDMETLYLGKTRRFLAKVCGILENSGLHVDVLHDFRIIEGLNDDDLRRFLYTEIDFHNDEWFKWVNSLGLIHMQGGVDRLIYTVIIGIKRINYKRKKRNVSRKSLQRRLRRRSIMNMVGRSSMRIRSHATWIREQESFMLPMQKSIKVGGTGTIISP